jgi:4-alpha-glucanotransferase
MTARGHASGIGTARASGILMHPTSLPGPHGIGELGREAHLFLDFLGAAGQSLWQVLPLGPTGYGDSPYACFSSFAGNPLLISIDTLIEWDLLSPDDVGDRPVFPPERVAFGPLIQWKMPLLRRAAARLLSGNDGARLCALAAFRAEEAGWLRDYCLFRAVKSSFEEKARRTGSTAGAWNVAWDRDIALRRPEAVERFTRELDAEIAVEEAIQFLFFSQWDALHAHAREKGVRIIGDLPIFAAPDSADVWAHQDLFLLDPDGRPTVVSGVPPDYFAATGQLWGNPLYDWKALERGGFGFWLQRIDAACRLFDLVRIDHFRGFEACWEVPGGAPTAEKGRWVKVPGARMFEALERERGRLPIIAEDLGVITPEVNALRERFGFPGMRILQFAFDSGEASSLDAAENRFLPHNHAADSVVYTGTHDNDTTRGWWESRTPKERGYLESYSPSAEPDIGWRFIRMAMESVCRFCVVPMQDVLGLGADARMNTPGTSSGKNWTWRAADGFRVPALAERLRSLAVLYGRAPLGRA